MRLYGIMLVSVLGLLAWFSWPEKAHPPAEQNPENAVVKPGEPAPTLTPSKQDTSQPSRLERNEKAQPLSTAVLIQSSSEPQQDENVDAGQLFLETMVERDIQLGSQQAFELAAAMIANEALALESMAAIFNMYIDAKRTRELLDLISLHRDDRPPGLEAKILAMAGETDHAIVSLQDIKNPSPAEREFLGDLLMKQGERDAAQQVYRNLLDQMSADDVLRDRLHLKLQVASEQDE